MIFGGVILRKMMIMWTEIHRMSLKLFLNTDSLTELEAPRSRACLICNMTNTTRRPRASLSKASKPRVVAQKWHPLKPKSTLLDHILIHLLEKRVKSHQISVIKKFKWNTSLRNWKLLSCCFWNQSERMSRDLEKRSIQVKIQLSLLYLWKLHYRQISGQIWFN